jgi:hypothetical protein
MNDPAVCKGLGPRLRGEHGRKKALTQPSTTGRGLGEGVIPSPHIHPHPEPVEGRGCADLVRVIARRSAPKQPRGTSTKVRVSLLGCFAALAMTQIYCRSRVPRKGGESR